jgi:hypothetical protein
VKSFRQTIANLLNVPQTDVYNIKASVSAPSTSCNRRRQLSSRSLGAFSSCIVTYEVKANSHPHMNELEMKMRSISFSSDAFTNEIQKTMITNDVTSVVPSSITADTTAAPQSAGNVGSADASSNKSTEDKKADSGKTLIITVLVCVLLITIVLVCLRSICYIVHRSDKTRHTKLHGDKPDRLAIAIELQSNPVHRSDNTRHTRERSRERSLRHTKLHEDKQEKVEIAIGLQSIPITTNEDLPEDLIL